MPVIGPKLSEISGELKGYPHWITEIVPGIRRGLGFYGQGIAATKQQNKKSKWHTQK